MADRDVDPTARLRDLRGLARPQQGYEAAPWAEAHEISNERRQGTEIGNVKMLMEGDVI
jgi:hypothetical protein